MDSMSGASFNDVGDTNFGDKKVTYCRFIVT